jgi:hypothetical protein
MFILFVLYFLFIIIGVIIKSIYGEGYDMITDVPFIKKLFGIDEIEIEEGLDDYIDSLD